MSSPYAILARYYDLQHNAFQDDAPLYATLAARQATDGVCRVLEIGCGTGRVMAPLLGAGHHVVGLDESQEMLDIAARRLADQPPARWALHRLDARAYTLEQPFDLAVIALNTFLHCASRDDQLATLRSACAHLRPGGALSVDLPPNDELANQPDDGEFQFEAQLSDPETGEMIVKHVASEIAWSDQAQTLRYRMESRLGNKARATQTVSFTLRHVFRHEMELLLLASGFDRWTWHGDYALGPYGDDSARVIVVAQPAR